MDWLPSLDVSLFRLINRGLSNALGDAVMPFFAGNPLFYPALAIIAALVFWRGSRAAWLAVIFLFFAVASGNLLVCDPLKDLVGRQRPFNVVTDAIVLLGRGGSGSMPSSHTFNWFLATAVLFLFHRPSWRFMLPLAAVVGFSRIYTGVHYPSDVAAGALLGLAWGAGFVLGVERLWQWAGPRWFPVWWARLPSFLGRETVRPVMATSGIPARAPTAEVQLLRLGYILIGVMLLARLVYLASGKIELTEDEAYQWVWSKHPALSYYSKPPMIAYTQWLGTHLWGDTEFGVRFFSPVITALVSWLLLRFVAREVNARAALGVVIALSTAPMAAAGSVLMTIDPLNVMFWAAAMITGWQAIRLDSTKHWAWTGLWMGLGFLSKYTALFQWLSWAVFFAIWPAARKQLRRPGPWLALGINLLCTLPVLYWNWQHEWITVTHLANRSGLDHSWKPTLRFFWDFLAVEPVLLNPVYFVFVVWAAVAFWFRASPPGVMVYFFSMGAPLFLFYFLYTFRARVQGNWIAPAVAPLFCLAVVYWEARWREGTRRVKPFFIAGLSLGLVAVILAHDTNLIKKLTGRALPAELDPLRRARAWAETGRLVNEARMKLQSEGGRPAFIIGAHYGITGLLSFYIPEAKAAVDGQALVYYQTMPHPMNQFYFWPGYQGRKGENAIYVARTDEAVPAPPGLVAEFESVKDLGLQVAHYRGRPFQTIQLFECRGLK